MALNEKLQTALDRLGNSPLEEPEIFKAIQSPTVKKSGVVKLALKDSTIEPKNFPASEIAEFYADVVERVTSVKNPDGTFKSTPATENCELPDFEEVEALIEVGVAVAKAQKNLEEVAEGDTEALKEAINAYTDALKALDELIWPISGLDREKFDSDPDIRTWEESLVASQILNSAAEVEKTSLGKR